MINRILLILLAVVVIGCKSHSIAPASAQTLSNQENINELPEGEVKLTQEQIDNNEALKRKEIEAKSLEKALEINFDEINKKTVTIQNDIEKKLMSCFFQWDYMFNALISRELSISKKDFETKNTQPNRYQYFEIDFLTNVVTKSSEYIYGKDLDTSLFLNIQGAVKSEFKRCLELNGLQETLIIRQAINLSEQYSIASLVKSYGDNQSQLTEMMNELGINLNFEIIEHVYSDEEFDAATYRYFLWIETLEYIRVLK